MPISGYVGAAAQDSLDNLLKRAMLEEQQRRLAESQAFQQEHALDQARESTRRFEVQQAGETADRAQRSRQLDALLQRQTAQDEIAAGERREKSNVRGTMEMLAEGLASGTVNPRDPEGRRTLGTMLMRAGEPGAGLQTLTAPTAEEARAARLAEREEELKLARKYDRPTQAPRDPLADYEARKLIDLKYEKPKAADTAAAEEALDTAREVERIASALKTHPGMPAAFGVYESRLPTFRQSTADAEVLRDSLTSLLTLENTGKLKGVLSNADMEILRQASSTIAPKMGDKAAATELTRVIGVMRKVTGRTPGGTGAATTTGETVVEYERDPRTGRPRRRVGG